MLFRKPKAVLERTSIRYTIFIYFTVSALAASLFLGISLYSRMAAQVSATVSEENQILIDQVNRSVENYLRTIMKLSDSLYYGVIKNADLSGEDINAKFTLLYDNNKDSIEKIALFSGDGALLEVVPAARMKNNLNVSKEEWFSYTLDRTENQHFFMPQVQHIFEGNEKQYRWIIPLTRAVEITQGPNTAQGVLLINISYTSLELLLDRVTLGNNGYVYLIDSKGEIICHPRVQLIDSGLEKENNVAAASYRDGVHRELFEGENRVVTVKSVGYTGWKVVGVAPENAITLNNIKTHLLIAFVIAFILFLLAITNSYISSKITIPIKKLERWVNKIEEGNLGLEIDIGGSYEIRHLGKSIQNMASQIQVLMDGIVLEHEDKRKKEFDTLQSQINPHFLYNTLDIIVWMIENEKPEQAVKMVTALARFFRISLSRGRSIITLGDELEHVRNYLMIQQMRYKNKFTYSIQTPDDLLGLASLKLMLQPIVENAIYHGMEFMDGDGEIHIRAWKDGNDLYISIEDNGLGMTEEQVQSLFNPEYGRGSHAGVWPEQRAGSSRSSGIGVKNVNERIRLYFGQDYGLSIWSEPDEGTRVTAHLPAVDYSCIRDDGTIVEKEEEQRKEKKDD